MIIRLEGVGKSFGAVAVIDDLDLAIADGEFFTLLGASGSGKTTTLRLIAGLDRLDRGRIRFDDTVISDPAAGKFVPPERRGLGMVFQSYALWPHLSVGGNLALGLEERRIPRAEIGRMVAAALTQVGLDGLDRRFPHELSGGQQQRVALARALVAEPRILLLDEPLSNVDAAVREQLRREIASLQRRLRITTVLVTHDQVEAMSVSDRIGIMRAGRIEQVDRPDVLYHRPRNAFVATFLGHANLLRGAMSGGAFGMGAARLAVSGAMPDGPAVLMMRPEGVGFGDGVNAFAAEIRQATLMGGLTRYDATVPALGVDLLIEEASVGPPRHGAVTINLPPARIVPLFA